MRQKNVRKKADPNSDSQCILTFPWFVYIFSVHNVGLPPLDPVQWPDWSWPTLVTTNYPVHPLRCAPHNLVSLAGDRLWMLDPADHTKAPLTTYTRPQATDVKYVRSIYLYTYACFCSLVSIDVLWRHLPFHGRARPFYKTPSNAAMTRPVLLHYRIGKYFSLL